MLRAELDGWDAYPTSRSQMSRLWATLGHFSVDGWRWVVSHLLAHALDAEHVSDFRELQWLVYFLSPPREAEERALRIVRGLSPQEVNVLACFLLWLESNQEWNAYAGDNIEAAREFLGRRLSARHVR